MRLCTVQCFNLFVILVELGIGCSSLPCSTRQPLDLPHRDETTSLMAQTPLNSPPQATLGFGRTKCAIIPHILSMESCNDGKALLVSEADDVDINSGKVLVAESDETPPPVGNGSIFQAGLAPTAVAAADLVVIDGASHSSGMGSVTGHRGVHVSPRFHPCWPLATAVGQELAITNR